MLFYKIEGILVDWEELKKRDEIRERAETLQTPIAEFFSNSGHSCHISVSGVKYNSKKGILCAAVSGGRLEAKTIDTFLSTVNFKISDYWIIEITMNAYIDLLRTSDRNGFLEDYEDVLEELDIEELSQRHRRHFSETVIEKQYSKNEMKQKAAEMLAHDTLNPEIDRIFMGKAVEAAVGHPVHYFLQNDDDSAKKQMLDILLTALFQNGRLLSRRYCEYNFGDGWRQPSESDMKLLYASCRGGTVVINYRFDKDEESEYARTNVGTIMTICQVMREYRNDVLTVFCLQRSCESVKQAFYEYLGNVTLVSMGEQTVFGNDAKVYLRALTRKYGIKGNRSLYKNIKDEGKGRTSSDLNKIFEQWHGKQMKTRVFSQYAELDSANKQIAKKETKGKAIDTLTNMIGLSESKDLIRQALDYYKAQKLFREKGFLSERPSMHMVFTGNPGTAKTTVARLFAQIMKDNNLLSVGDLFEVGRADLVGKYVGWTAPMIKSKFKAAKGSVLFIDEAYSLVDGKDGYYGDEAINTIVQEMENYRDDMVVIFAGYPDKMEGFLNKNPGLRSRIAFHVTFADYNADELYQITELLASDKKLKLCESVQEKLVPIFETAMRNCDFGNGRFARNMLEKAILRQASRLVSMDVDEVTIADIEMLTAEDFEVPDMKVDKVIKIGFAS